MRDIELINRLLVKYDLVVPVLPADQKRIYSSKKKTLAVILGKNGKSGVMTSAAVRFYYIMQGLGLKVTLVSGARAAVFASVIALMVVAGGSVILLQNYLYKRGVIAVNEIQKNGVIVVSLDSKIIRGGTDLSSVRSADAIMEGDQIITGEYPVLLQFDNRTVVKINRKSAVYVTSIGAGLRLDIKNGGILTRVPHLADGLSYEIYTPEAAVSVKGTEFGVLHEAGKTVVFVSDGTVKIKHVPGGIEYNLSKGYSTEVDGANVVSPIKENELIMMKAFSELIYVESIDSKKPEELQFIKDRLTGPEAAAVTVKPTLEALKEKYGKIDELVLYSGRRYTGVIVSRGEFYRILTPGGTVSIPAKEVKGSRIIQ